MEGGRVRVKRENKSEQIQERGRVDMEWMERRGSERKD